jgi:hypothetical protein
MTVLLIGVGTVGAMAMIGVIAFGWGYVEGLQEARRRH